MDVGVNMNLASTACTFTKLALKRSASNDSLHLGLQALDSSEPGTTEPLLQTFMMDSDPKRFSRSSESLRTYAASLKSSVPQSDTASVYTRYSFHKSHITLAANGETSTVTPGKTITARAELNAALGEDCIPHTTEIEKMPCAGIRITHGALEGLVAWRFVVRPSDPWGNLTGKSPAVVANFILDTGSQRSLISQEALIALGYRGGGGGVLQPGTPVTLVIQGIETPCVVAQDGEASRLCLRFMTSGSLTFYFDSRLDAPVLFVESESRKPKMDDIPRTVKQTLQQKVKLMINSFVGSMSPP